MPQLMQFHSQLVRLGFSTQNLAMGRLIKFCALSPSGNYDYALHLFYHLPSPDAFIYNTLFRGHLFCHNLPSILLLYHHMLNHYVLPNKFTYPPLISACSMDNTSVPQGKQIHAHVFKFGFQHDDFLQNNLIRMYLSFRSPVDAGKVFDKMHCRDLVSWTTLITGYSQCGLVDDAFQTFNAMPQRNPVSWNAMIAAFIQSNRFDDALALFVKRMDARVFGLDKFVGASLLSACTALGALKLGESIHGYMRKSKMELLDSGLATKLIDMYCKCGCLDEAFRVFSELSRHPKDISSWNCLIGGLAMHGKGRTAIELFKKMEKQRTRPPDYVTFVNLLNACAHSGLVSEGRYYFKYMTKAYGITPGAEHYGCLIDLLGRAGFLDEAKNIVEEIKPQKAGVLGALLGACKIHGNTELGERFGKEAIEADPWNSGRYVLLANLYAKAGRWGDASETRRLMDQRGVKKVRGFSKIEVGGFVSEFIAGGWKHPEAELIYRKVDEMVERIRPLGYHGLLGCYHSEMLAVAFGLLKSGPGSTLRIFKNLRVCSDCHLATKLVSLTFDREIVMRDSHRFHHFKKGNCSCNDYW